MLAVFMRQANQQKEAGECKQWESECECLAAQLVSRRGAWGRMVWPVKALFSRTGMGGKQQGMVVGQAWRGVGMVHGVVGNVARRDWRALSLHGGNLNILRAFVIVSCRARGLPSCS